MHVIPALIQENVYSLKDDMTDILDKMQAADVIVVATPTYFLTMNGMLKTTIDRFLPKSAEWVGYILRIDGQRIYIAGDTDATKEARAVRCDVALVPIGGTYTMDAKKAAELVNEIRPSVAIPENETEDHRLY